MSEYSTETTRCAQERVRLGEVGTVGCAIDSCLVTLFAREGEGPVHLNSFTYCGQVVYPIDSAEWTPVVVSTSTVRVGGQLATRIAVRDTLVSKKHN